MKQKEVLDRIRSAMDLRRVNQSELARRLNRDRSAMSRMLSAERGISVDDLMHISRTLGVSSSWLIEGTGAPTDAIADNQKRPDDTFAPTIIPGDELVSQRRDLPVYAAAKGGDGHVIITFDPISYMKMPAVLQGVKGGYGLLLSGESMVPAYRPGETALVNPNLPPMRDEDVILYHTSEMDENEAIIKRLVGFNDREWVLEQYNPHKEFKEFRGDWPVCHRVVGKYNTR